MADMFYVTLTNDTTKGNFYSTAKEAVAVARRYMKGREGEINIYHREMGKSGHSAVHVATVMRAEGVVMTRVTLAGVRFL